MKIPPFISQPLPPSPQGEPQSPIKASRQTCPLLPQGNLRRKALHIPNTSKSSDLRHTGQGTMSLAGAGRSPQLSPTGAPDPQKQTRSLRLIAESNPRRKANLNPQKSKSPDLRLRVKGRCPLRVQGGARNYRRQAHPNLKSKPNGLRLIAVRQSPPQGNPRRQASLPPTQASRQACPLLPKAIPAARRTMPPNKANLRPAPTAAGQRTSDTRIRNVRPSLKQMLNPSSSRFVSAI